MKLKRLLGSFDLFGAAPTLTFQGQTRSTTGFGSFLGLIVVGIMAATFIIWGQDVYAHSNPIINRLTIDGGSQDRKIYIGKDKFHLGFGLTNVRTGAYYANSSIYTIKPFLVNGATFKRTLLDVEMCPVSDFGNKNKGYVYCFSETQTNVEELYITTQAEWYIMVFFSKCQNATSGNTCADKDYMNGLISNSSFSGFFPDTSIDPRNYSSPFTQKFKPMWANTMPSIGKRLTAGLKEIQLTTNDGWLFDSKKNESYMAADGNYILDFFEMTTLEEFFVFSIYNNGGQEAYERSYKKVQDLLAQVGGFAGTIIMLIGLLARPYFKLKMQEEMINKLFVVKKQGPQEQKPAGADQGTVLSFTESPLKGRRNLSSGNFSLDDIHNVKSLPSPTREKLVSFPPQKNEYVESRLPTIPDEKPVAIQNTFQTTPNKESGDKEAESPAVIQVETNRALTPSKESGDTESPLPLKKEQSLQIEMIAPTVFASLRSNSVGIEIQGKKEKFLNISFFEWLLAMTGICQSHQMKVFVSAKRYLTNKFDVIELFDRVNQMEKVRDLALCEERKRLLKENSKPSINIREQTRKKKTIVEVNVEDWTVPETIPQDLSKMKSE